MGDGLEASQHFSPPELLSRSLAAAGKAFAREGAKSAKEDEQI